MVKIEIFHTFSKEKYRDSQKQGDCTPYFQYDFLIKIWSKLRFLILYLRKSIEIAKNRVILTLIFSMIPL